MDERPEVNAALDLLRASGGRVTRQRRIVIEGLLDAPLHPSADDIAARVAAVAPDIHLSTVYRTLATLTELGVITHVHLDHGRSVYHFADETRPHLVCRSCGAVAHVDEATFVDVRARVERDTGMRLEHGHFAWSATCPECCSDP